MARDLGRHQDYCERSARESREEARRDADQIKAMITRLEDQMNQRFSTMEKEIEERHNANQKAVRDIWKALIYGLVAIIAVLWAVLERGGIAALIKSF